MSCWMRKEDDDKSSCCGVNKAGPTCSSITRSGPWVVLSLSTSWTHRKGTLCFWFSLLNCNRCVANGVVYCVILKRDCVVEKEVGRKKSCASRKEGRVPNFNND